MSYKQQELYESLELMKMFSHLATLSYHLFSYVDSIKQR